MYLTIEPFGTLPGRENQQRQPVLYIMENDGGASVAITDYGARIVRLCVPDRHGVLADVVLGHDDVCAYVRGEDYLGATCGRVANRIGPGGFHLGGRTYALNCNENQATLHGGAHGFNQALWDAAGGEDGLLFTLVSPDGDQGFPGELRVQVRFTLTEDNTLRICYEAVGDRDTIVSLTNHAYFNLDGQGSKTVLAHQLSLAADSYLPVGDGMLPTGEIRSVTGTPFDFTKPFPIGGRIDSDDEQLRRAGGYDHNFCLARQPRERRVFAARLEGESGRIMECWTDMPGIQVYTANFLTPRAGKNGASYDRRCAVCLETQFWPDFMAHREFFQPILSPGQVWTSNTEYRFLAE